MSQKLADDRQAKSAACAEARIGMTEVMKAHAGEAGTFRHRLPRTFQVSAGSIRIVTWHDISAQSRKAGEHGQCRSVQDHSFLAGLENPRETTIRAPGLPAPI